MPKYYEFKVYGYYLYFTTHCILEAMHVHANKDGKLTEHLAAKFFVRSNGDTVVEKTGDINARDILKLQKFIKENYKDMYQKWSELSDEGFFEN